MTMVEGLLAEGAVAGNVGTAVGGEVVRFLPGCGRGRREDDEATRRRRMWLPRGNVQAKYEGKRYKGTA